LKDRKTTVVTGASLISDLIDRSHHYTNDSAEPNDHYKLDKGFANLSQISVPRPE
jgi:hypothetical protein